MASLASLVQTLHSPRLAASPDAEFGADLDGLVKHVMYAQFDLGVLGVTKGDEDLKQLKGVPRVALHVGDEGLDGWAGVGYVVHSHNTAAKEGNDVEGVGGERE